MINTLINKFLLKPCTRRAEVLTAFDGISCKTKVKTFTKEDQGNLNPRI